MRPFSIVVPAPCVDHLSGMGIAGEQVFVQTLVYSTISTILKTALYIYATEGHIPQQFDPDVIKKPFEKS